MRNAGVGRFVPTLLALALSAPAVTEASTTLSLCEAPTVTTVTCSPTEPDFSLEINEEFEVVVRNCSGDAAAALVTLVYSMPPTTPPGPDEFSADERTFAFANHGEEAVCSIIGAPGGEPNVIDVAATPYRVTGGTWEERLLPPTLQAQRYEGAAIEPPPPTLTLTPELTARLRADLLTRDQVAPVGHPTTCAFPEANWSVVDNRGRGHWRGSLFGKTVCTETHLTPDSCAAASPGTNPVATHSGVGTLDLTPESSFRMFVNGPPGGPQQLFNRCCDPREDTAQSQAAVQCSRVSINQMVVDSQTYTLSPAFISDWTRDIEPSLVATLPPSAVQFSCMEFNAAAPPLRAVDPWVAFLTDNDLDGVFDNCDFLLGSRSTEEGGSIATLRRFFRLEDFNESGSVFTDFSASTVEEVRVNNTAVPHDFVPDEELPLVNLELLLPQGLPLGSMDVGVDPVGAGDLAVARDRVRIIRPRFREHRWL